MADGRDLNSSVSCHQNYPHNWNLHEMIRYKDEKCFSYDGKRIKWLDTLEMLKIFTKNVVGQLGNWLSPDGRFKKFVSSNSDLSLAWNYENGSLSFRGKVGDCLKELFISMYSTKEGKAASRTSYELVSPIIDSTLRVGQAMPDTSGLAIDSESVQSNCETITSNSDGTTLEELLYRSFLIDHIKTYRLK